MLDAYLEFEKLYNGDMKEYVEAISITMTTVLTYIVLALYGSLKFVFRFGDKDDIGEIDIFDNYEKNEARKTFRDEQKKIRSECKSQDGGGNRKMNGGGFPYKNETSRGKVKNNDTPSNDDKGYNFGQNYMQKIEEIFGKSLGDVFCQIIGCFQEDFAKINGKIQNGLLASKDSPYAYFLLIILIPALHILYGGLGSTYHCFKHLIKQMMKIVKKDETTDENEGDGGRQDTGEVEDNYLNIMKDIFKYNYFYQENDKNLNMHYGPSEKRKWIFAYFAMGYVITAIITLIMELELKIKTHPFELLVNNLSGPEGMGMGDSPWQILGYFFALIGIIISLFMVLPQYLIYKIMDKLVKASFLNSSNTLTNIFLGIFLTPLMITRLLRGELDSGQGGFYLLITLLLMVIVFVTSGLNYNEDNVVTVFVKKWVLNVLPQLIVASFVLLYSSGKAMMKCAMKQCYLSAIVSPYTAIWLFIALILSIVATLIIIGFFISDKSMDWKIGVFLICNFIITCLVAFGGNILKNGGKKSSPTVALLGAHPGVPTGVSTGVPTGAFRGGGADCSLYKVEKEKKNKYREKKKDEVKHPDLLHECFCNYSSIVSKFKTPLLFAWNLSANLPLIITIISFAIFAFFKNIALIPAMTIVFNLFWTFGNIAMPFNIILSEINFLEGLKSFFKFFPILIPCIMVTALIFWSIKVGLLTYEMVSDDNPNDKKGEHFKKSVFITSFFSEKDINDYFKGDDLGTKVYSTFASIFILLAMGISKFSISQIVKS